MNTNAWIFFTSLLSLLLCLLVARSVLQHHSIVQRNIFASLALLLLLCSISGAISLGWRMTHVSPSISEQTPLPSQSQIIGQTSLTRFSLNGKDGTLALKYPYQSVCTMNRIFAQANGVIYERGALPQQQEGCIQATRLNTGAELWSTKIKASQSAESLTGNTLPSDQLLVEQDRLYLQVDGTLYILDVSSGKILHTIPPTLSDDKSASLDNFFVDDQALVLLYRTEHSYSLVVLSPTTQNVQWKYTRGTFFDLIALQRKTLYIHDQGIVALDVSNGLRLWRTDLPSSGLLGASATPERVYVRVQNTYGSDKASIYAYGARNGQLLWKAPVDSWAGSSEAGPNPLTPIEAGGVVYVVDTNTLRAYQANTGRVLWQYKQDPLASDSIHADPYQVIYFSQPVIVGKVVFVAATVTTSYPPPLKLFPSFCLGRCTAVKPNIVALNAMNGKSYWHYEVPMSAAILTAS